MVAPPSSHSRGWLVAIALALLCVAAAVLRGRTGAEFRAATVAAAPPNGAVRQAVQQETHPTGRKMVGGYSSTDPELLGSAVIAEVAAVALNAHAAGASSLALLATPEEVAGGGKSVLFLVLGLLRMSSSNSMSFSASLSLLASRAVEGARGAAAGGSLTSAFDLLLVRFDLPCPPSPLMSFPGPARLRRSRRARWSPA